MKYSDKYRNWFDRDDLVADLMIEAADDINERDAEIERLRRIICNLLDDGDETDRAAARAALKGDE
jgi:hypothetical protein